MQVNSASFESDFGQRSPINRDRQAQEACTTRASIGHERISLSSRFFSRRRNAERLLQQAQGLEDLCDTTATMHQRADILTAARFISEIPRVQVLRELAAMARQPVGSADEEAGFSARLCNAADQLRRTDAKSAVYASIARSQWRIDDHKLRASSRDGLVLRSADLPSNAGPGKIVRALAKMRHADEGDTHGEYAHRTMLLQLASSLTDSVERAKTFAVLGHGSSLIADSRLREAFRRSVLACVGPGAESKLFAEFLRKKSYNTYIGMPATGARLKLLRTRHELPADVRDPWWKTA